MRRWLLAAAVLTLAGCSDPPDTGVVTNAQFHPAWVQTIPGQPPTMQCNGSPPQCTMSPGTPPQFINWPNSWELELADGPRKGWRDVPEYVYAQCQVGDHYPECGKEGN